MMVQPGISRVGCVARAAWRGGFAATLAMFVAALVSACVDPVTLATKAVATTMPPMRWDHRPEAPRWTAAALVAVAGRDDVLAGRVPADIATWCPGYQSASRADRRAFWVGMMSALAKYESSWNPGAAGGRGKWIGLMQISPQTARQHGCTAQSAKALKSGEANLACAVRIFAAQVGHDGVVAGGGGRGMGRDWAPLHAASKRAEMAAWTRVQPYCVKG